jgi:hypothetical protein
VDPNLKQEGIIMRQHLEKLVKQIRAVTLSCAALAGMLLGWAVGPAEAATYHTLPYGEPYALEGTRMCFTTWYWVKPGRFDWTNDEGKSVFTDRSVMAGPNDPHTHWKEYDLPHGVKLICEKARKGDFPIRPEEPWEKDGIEITGLTQLPDKLIAWGKAHPGGDCYFESFDQGKTWLRPDMNQREFEGSKENNLISGGDSRAFYDPQAPPEERWKKVANSDYDLESFQEYKKKYPYDRMALEIDPGRVHAIFGYVSPDGFNWTKLPEPLSVETSDGGQYVYYDKKLKEYVVYSRGYMVGPRADDFPLKHTRYHAFSGRRAITRTASADFRHFPLSEVVIDTGNHMSPTDTFYFCTYTTIPNAPEHHLMFPSRYRQDIDGGAIDFYTSYDGKLWNLVEGSPVLDLGDYGQWDGGAIWTPSPGLVELHDGTWIIPFRGDPLPHKYPRGLYSEKWGAAIWPKGRLMAIEAEEEGYFATQAFIAPGGKLRINALTARTGGVLVEAADFYGKPIPGRTFEDCSPLIGDQHKTLVTWKNADDMGVKAGEPVILRFRMKKAKIYFLDFE